MSELSYKVRRAADFMDRIGQARRDWRFRSPGSWPEEQRDLEEVARVLREKEADVTRLESELAVTKRRSVERAEQLAAAIEQQERAERRAELLMPKPVSDGSEAINKYMIDLEGWAVLCETDVYGAIVAVSKAEGNDYSRLLREVAAS